ncbi:InlB B-repeat-containing protein [Butyricicoccus sp. OF27-2pH9A]|uniref:InlB B-repeat-containing protein n=1 Tax=Butyricicoccus sp. OF27-2pH9A TaxID=3002517 RepID=UPI0022E988EE|nr:S-layer homology domain-containing protein [Butyricicoccus sp. OF27-2pH9A]
MKYKRGISLTLTAALLLSMLPQIVLPKAAAANIPEREIDSSTYAALGLSLNAEDKGASLTAPYSKKHVSQAFTASEVYVAASGSQANRYLIRDGFDRMETNNRDSAVYDGNNKSNVQGNLDGAYIRYGVSSYGLPSDKGSTYASKLSSNSRNLTDYNNNDFSGIYATSTAFNKGDGKDNYVAELRAYGRGEKTTIGSKKYDGKFELALFKVNDNGKRSSAGTLSPTVTKNMTYGDGMAYFTRRYVQEMDAIMDVAAADVNGDGKDELFVYAGRWKDENGTRYAYVDVFDTASMERTGQLKINAGTASAYQQATQWQWQIEKIPVVTLAGGDLDRDGKEEIAVTASAPTDNSNVASAAHLTVFTEESGTLTPVSGLDTVSLADGEQAMVSANCAFGTFSLPDTGITGTVLIAAGYQSNNASSAHDSGAYTTAAYRFAYYDPQSKKFKLSEYRTQALGDSGKKIAQSYIDDPDEDYYRPVHAPIALGCADMEGIGANNSNDEVLLGGEIYDFDTTGGITTQLSSVSVCTSQVNINGKNKAKEQVWISDVQAGVVDSNPSGQSEVKQDNKWRESFVYVAGVHRKEPVNGSDDYYWMDLGAAYLTGAKSGASDSTKNHIFYSTQEGVIAESSRRNDNTGTFVSLALPDFGNDSITMRYVADYTVYTNPEVYAVLQASPYFADLNETYDYIGNGGTAYGTSKSTGDTKTASVSQALGVYHSLEIQALAGGEYEVELSASYSYDYAESTEIEHSVTYNAQAGGGDMAVVYTIPYQYYIYEMYDPDSKQWSTTILPAALDPTVAVLDVESYDEIAAETKGLEPISGNLLYSTPGEPETYANQPAGTREFIFGGAYAHTGASSTTADTTQEITKTTGKEHSHAFNLELNYKVGGGSALLGNKGYVGVTGSTGAGGGWSKSSADGTAFSGTVDSLPAEATQYGFEWKLIVNNAQLDGTPVWIVGYEVKNVTQPPRMPQNLTVTEVSTSTVDLEWESSGGAAYYEISMIDQHGEYNKIATVPYTVTQYQVTDLDANTDYRFSVRAVSPTKGSSIDSPIAYATTLNGTANFEITTHPEDASTAAGKTATFTAAATFTDDSGAKPVSYQWQVKTTDSKAQWRELKNSTGVSGANGPALTITAAEEMNGYAYRCRVYVKNRSLYTKSAALDVSRVPTRIQITPKDDTVWLSGGTLTTSAGTTVTGQKAVTLTSGDKTYSLLSGGNQFFWFDGAAYYAYKGPAPTLTGGLVGTTQTFDTSNIDSTALDVAQTSPQAVITVTDNDGKTDTRTIALSDSTDDDTTQITYNGESYTVQHKWSGTIGSDSYSFYEAKNTEDTVYLCTKSGEATYSAFALQYAATLVNGINTNNLTPVYQATQTAGTNTKTENITGKQYPLTASVWENGSKPTGMTGTVTFIISGAGIEGQTITVDLDTNQANASKPDFQPRGEGAATITAMYSGDDVYAPSTASVNVYFVLNKQNRSVLSLTASANVTYGERANLAATLTSQNGTSQNVTATYKVEKLVSGKYVSAVSDTDYTLENGVFTPKLVTNYRITATYQNLTDSKVIIVSKGTLTLSAADTSKALNDTRTPAAAKVSGLAAWDTVSLAAGTDYTLTSEGTTAALPGKYPIYIALKDSQKIQSLQEKYNILLKNAVYTLSGKSYVVSATGDTNGTVSISYQADAASAVLPVSSGSRLPAGSKVTFTAAPKAGYTVSRWKVGTDYVADSGSTYYNNISYTINNLSENVDVSVNFTAGTSTLTYKADSTAIGSVTANYLTDGALGSAFVSGGNVNYSQTIRVSAQPKDGYAVDRWEVNGETLKTADGTHNYTGSTYTFDKFTENVTVTVYFVENSHPVVTIKPVDNDGKPLTGAKVSVGGTELTGTDGVFTYTAHTGENPVITVTPPDGLLVDSWTATPATEGTLSTDNRVMALHDLRQNTTFVVKCTALNRYTVAFQGKMADGSAITDVAGTVSAVKLGAGALTSGESQLQGSTIQFTAQANTGYEIAGWKLNGNAVTPTASGTYQIPSLNGNAALVVTFRQQPKITLSAGKNGTLTCDSHTGSSFYLPCGSKNALTFTAQPESGYRVAGWTVNDNDVSGSAVINSDNQTYTYTPNADGITEDVTVSVAFEKIPTAKIAFSVVDTTPEDDNSGENGTLSAVATRHGTNTALRSGDEVLSGSEVTFTAQPNQGYKVQRWYLDGTEQAGAPTLNITDSDTAHEVKVQFTEISSAVTFGIAEDSDTGHGASLSAAFLRAGMSQPDAIASGNNVTAEGKLTVTVENLHDGYKIAGWTLNGAVYAQNGKPYTGSSLACDVSATQGADIRVKLERKSYEVTFSAQTGGGITNDKSLTSGSTVKGDTEIKFTASAPASGYTFIGWKVNSTMHKTDATTYTLTVTEDTEIIAYYEIADAEYTVTYGVIPTSGADNGTLTVSGPDADGKAKSGTRVAFTAVPDTGYIVENWYADAAGITAIGTAESTTYVIDPLTGNTSVYVRFVPIPTHTVTVNISGSGTVSAKVNGADVAITCGMLTVPHHAAVVLTAQPSSGAYLTGWTLDGTAEGNALTLNLNNVTKDHTIDAAFGVSQMVTLTTVCGDGGKLTVKRADGTTIDASGGIQVPKGAPLTLTAAPDSGKMVQAWTVNGTAADELSNTFTLTPIENSKVQVDFENVTLFDLPADNAKYTFLTSSRTPNDYGTERQIRKGGTIEFAMLPAEGYLIRNLDFQGGTVTRCALQTDGSWSIRMEKVVSTITFKADIYSMVPLTITAPQNGTLTVKLGDTVLTDGAKLATGDILTIAADPATGYTLDKLTVSGATKQPGGTYKVDAAAVSVSASFKSTGGTSGGGGAGGGGGTAPAEDKRIIVENSKNGAVSPSDSNAKPDTKVTLTIKPNSGKRLSGLTVTDEKGNTLPLTRKDAAHYEFTMPAGKVTVKPVFTDSSTSCPGGIICPTHEMSDVPLDAWYHDVVDTAVDCGWMNGTGNSQFTPQGTTTRGMLATVLYRMAGSPKAPKSTFADVESSMYYADAVAWAAENGIVTGLDATTYAPAHSITREQLAAMLYRMAQHNGQASAGSADVLNDFADRNAVHDWAKDAMCWAIENGLITGKGNAVLDPTGTATRAEVAAMLTRFHNLAGK